MQPQLRILRLHALARLRAAGWAPWLLLAGWLIAARVQEPRMFRRFGIHLIDDAAWVGGLLVLFALLFVERRLPKRAAVAANLSLLAGLALVLAIFCRLLDQGSWSAGMGTRLLGALQFFVAYAPLCICLAAGLGTSMCRRLVSVSVVLVAMLTGSMLATAFRSEATALTWGAASLSLVASATWVASRENKPKYL